MERFLDDLRTNYEKESGGLETERLELEKSNASLREDLAAMESKLVEYHEVERVVAEVFFQARFQADSILNEAKSKAEAIEKDAGADVAVLQDEFNWVHSQYWLAMDDIQRLLDRYQTVLGQVPGDESGNGARIVHQVLKRDDSTLSLGFVEPESNA